MTPRKTQARQKSQPSQPHNLQQQVQPSDYESATEAPFPEPPPTRTNTDLNLSVLRRYIPNITDIPALASSGEVYTFSRDTQQWERAETLGTMFICELDHGAGFCLMILNKKSMENLIINMTAILGLETAAEFLIVTYVGVAGEKSLGFFIQDVPEGTRDHICSLTRHYWERVSDIGAEVQETVQVYEDEREEISVAQPLTGQRLSLSELFRR